jgi:hypothetical protein
MAPSIRKIFFNIAMTRQIKALILMLLLVISNAISFYSAVYAQGTAVPGLVDPSAASAATTSTTSAATAQKRLSTSSSSSLGPSTPPGSNTTNTGNSGINYPAIGSSGSPVSGVLNQVNQTAQLTSLVNQASEQDFQNWTDIANLTNNLANGGQMSEPAGGTEASYVFQGIQAAVYYIFGLGWLPYLGWIVGKLLQQFIVGWIAPTIGNFLMSRLIAFKDNPDVSFQTDAFSIQVRQLAHLVRDFALDLLLLFLIMSIWRTWNNAVWGRGNLWGVIGRIIAATGAIIVWPEIYHYTILIANNANDLFIQNLNANDLGEAVTQYFINAVSFPGSTFSAGSMVPFDWAFELLVNFAIGIATFVSLLAFFVEKAIQLTIVIMAYVFGPFFLACLASPDSESYSTNFIRVFIEATLWNFIWGGLTTLLVYVVNSSADPSTPVGSFTGALAGVTNNTQNSWFVLLLVLGILQAMLQVPGYLARGHLSAKAGVLEMGFAASGMKQFAGLFYGDKGMISAIRQGARTLMSEKNSIHPGPSGVGGAPPALNPIGPTPSPSPTARTAAPLNPASGAGVPGTTGGGALAGAVSGGSSAPPIPVTATGAAGGAAGVSQSSVSTNPPSKLHSPSGQQGLIDKVAGFAHDDIRNAGRTNVRRDAHAKQAYTTTAGVGQIAEIVIPANASAGQEALAVTHGALANLDEKGHLPKPAEKALKKAMVAEGFKDTFNPLRAFNPFREKANLFGYTSTPLAERFARYLGGGRESGESKQIAASRDARVQNRVIAEGVNAYMQGKGAGQGDHPIAKYLAQRYGVFDDNARAMSMYHLTRRPNESASLSGGLNDNRLRAIQAAKAAKQEPNGTVITAASHPFILDSMNGTEKGYAIPAVANLLKDYAGHQFGSAATDMKATQLYPLYDSLMPYTDEKGTQYGQISNDHALAAMVIGKGYGWEYATAENVNNLIAAKNRITPGRYDDRKAFELCVSGVVGGKHMPPVPKFVPRNYQSFTHRIPN